MLHGSFDVPICRPSSSVLIEDPARKLTLDVNSSKLQLSRLAADPLSGCHVHHRVHLPIEILAIRGAHEVGRHVLPLAHFPAMLRCLGLRDRILVLVGVRDRDSTWYKLIPLVRSCAEGDETQMEAVISTYISIII